MSLYTKIPKLYEKIIKPEQLYYGICRIGKTYYYRNYKHNLKNGKGLNWLQAYTQVSYLNLPDFVNIFNKEI